MRRPTGPPGFGAGRRMDVRERRIPVRDGVRIRVEDRGTRRPGVPLILLHGFTGSVEAWGETLLDALASTRRVVALDIVGHGGSDRPDPFDRYGLAEVVADVRDVMDVLEIDRAVWLGYSMGGRVALGGAFYCPDRIGGLVLESASPGLRTEEERRQRRASDDALAVGLEEGGIERFVQAWMELPLFESQQRLPEATLEVERQRRLAGHPSGLARSLRGLGTGAQPSFWDRLPEVVVPVLVLTGELDEKFGPIGDRMVERLPDGERRSVPGAGHAVHLERPGAWMAAVLSFLERRFEVTDGGHRG